MTDNREMDGSPLVGVRRTPSGVPLMAAPSDEDLHFVDDVEPLHVQWTTS